jgi:transposase
VPKKLECNYDRNIYVQLEEMIIKSEKLEKEIKILKASHRQEIYILKENHAKLIKEAKYPKEIREIKERHEIETKSLKASHKTTIEEIKSEQRAETGKLKDVIRRQAEEIERLKKENESLKGIVEKNSGNSSKPPSSDGFKKIINSREKTGRKAGGQAGHIGTPPKFYENPTKIIEIKAKKCGCGGNIEYMGETYAKKQYVDIEIKTNVVEYREYTGTCSCCGCAVSNRSPLKDSVTYGNNLKSLINMLSVEGNVSINRIRQMLSEISGGLLNLSEGTICKWQRDLSKLLAPSIQTIKEKLLCSPVLHKDETGVWVDKKLNWFHVLSNKEYTLYCSEPRRGKDADIEAGVLPAYKGVLVHDNLKSLYHFDCTHAECNAHILRYLRGAVESKNRRWAKDMIEFLLYAKKIAENNAVQSSDIPDFHRMYDDILELGQAEFLRDDKPDYHADDWKLLRRLKEYKEQHLLFLSDRNVPFDNNQAERDLRMIKAKTKISGCFRSADGDGVFAALKSYTSTLRKNGRNIFHALISAWNATPVLF